MDASWKLIDEMQANGIPPDEFAYTAIINGYKRASPVRKMTPLSRTLVARSGGDELPGGMRLAPARASVDS